MTSTTRPPAPRRPVAALGVVLGVLLVVLAEFALLTLVYHSGDGARREHDAWSRLLGAESGWRPGESAVAVRQALSALDAVAGDRTGPVDAAASAWAQQPSLERFADLMTTTVDLGHDLGSDRTGVDRRADLIHGGLLLLASVGWFLWFRRVVRRQRRLQRSLTEFEVVIASEQRLTALVRNSVDLVMVIDPDTTVSFASPSTVGVLGRQPGDLVGRRIGDLVTPADAQTLTGLLATGGAGDQAILGHARHADGRELVLEGTLTNLLADDAVNGWVLTVRDVTERLALQEELTHQALHDSLTGLANRQLFTERLSHALRRRSGSMEPLVVLFLDIDDFKNVNDSLGHGTGDELLRQFARRLTATIRQGDTAARLGGDEFAVLMEDCDLSAAQVIADSLVEELAVPMTVGDVELTICSSIGLAVAQPGETSAQDALRNADVAMYFAKDRGKGRLAVYDSDLHASALRRLEVRAELSAAITAGDLVVHYQPAYRMDTGEVDGYEALVRWQHPERGLLYPDQFVEIAEQSGLIVPLGRWVLTEACRATVTHLTTPDAGPVIAVNVSARQLAEPGFYDEVVAALADSGLDPARLVLEITETTLLDDRLSVVATLDRLCTLGVHIAIDDFGTGYSSLSYLADLPVEILKIDKSFVDGIGYGGESLVEAIIRLGDSLGLITLAEGVEQPEQARWLRQAGCQIGQGYLWSRPVPLDQARAALLATPRPAASAVG